MMKRPTSVTIVAWFLIVVAVVGLYTSTMYINNPMARELMAKSLLPISLQFVMLYAGLCLNIVAGIAMFKRKNWARFLYVIWTAIAMLIGLVTSPIKTAMIPGLVIFAVITFLLFRPKANEYFSPKGGANDAKGV